MIDEFFILKSSNLFYHYSVDKKEKDLDNIILSSGLLSALETFTKEARSDQINSFQTETEIFKFTKMPETDYTLVFVFNASIFNENISNLIIENIYQLVSESEITKKGSKLIDLNSGSNFPLTVGIEYILNFKILQHFSDKHLTGLFSNERNIELCVIKENPGGVVKASYSKRIGYLSKSLLNNHDLIISVINKALNNLNLSKKFLIITLESEDQQFLIFNMESYSISFLSSSIKSSDYYVDLLKNFAFSTNIFNFARYKLANFEITTKYLREEGGKIVFQEGILLPRKANVFLGTLTNNISNFSKEILSKNLEVFSVVFVNLKNELSIMKGIYSPKNQMELEFYVD